MATTRIHQERILRLRSATIAEAKAKTYPVLGEFLFLAENSSFYEVIASTAAEDPPIYNIIEPANAIDGIRLSKITASVSVGSDDVLNQSSVAGSNVTQALDNLLTLASANVYGQDLQIQTNELLSSTVSQLYQNKVTLNATGLTIGAQYQIQYYAELNIAATNRSILARVQSGLVTVAEISIENKDVTDFHCFSGFSVFTALIPTRLITLDYRKLGGGGALANIRRARLKLIRIS